MDGSFLSCWTGGPYAKGVYGKLLIALLTQKLIRIGRDNSPSKLRFAGLRTASPWREFFFARHQIQRAIEPLLTLKETLDCGPQGER